MPLINKRQEIRKEEERNEQRRRVNIEIRLIEEKQKDYKDNQADINKAENKI